MELTLSSAETCERSDVPDRQADHSGTGWNALGSFHVKANV